MTIEEKLKHLILEKYKSIRAFTMQIHVPYSTIDTMFKRGISGTGISTIVKICNALDIDATALIENKIVEKVDDSIYNFSQLEKKHIEKYRKLDDYSKEIVDFILDKEYHRLKNDNNVEFSKDDEIGIENIDISKRNEINLKSVDISMLHPKLQNEILSMQKEVLGSNQDIKDYKKISS